MRDEGQTHLKGQHACHGTALLRAGLLAAWLCTVAAPAAAQQVLTVAAFPAVDEIVKAAIPAWKKLHPTDRKGVV